MVGQSFFYNAVFFTYALVMVEFYGVRSESVGWYVLPLALGNFVGPLVLGRWFDTIGRKPMIVGTYVLSGVALALVSGLFARGLLSAAGHAIAFAVVFFIASSAASAAYLTVSEVFPLEIRALAIATFYAIGTLAGGVGAPALFGVLIGTHSRTMLMWGYVGAATLMVVAGIVEGLLGVKAERKSLEKIAAPLSSNA
jgi:MFS family permease